jgi:hypothetical protein
MKSSSSWITWFIYKAFLQLYLQITLLSPFCCKHPNLITSGSLECIVYLEFSLQIILSSLDVLVTLPEVAVGCSTCYRFMSRCLCLWIQIPILTLTQTKQRNMKLYPVFLLLPSFNTKFTTNFCQSIRSGRRQAKYIRIFYVLFKTWAAVFY